MDKHYYLAINSNRIITSNGLDFNFDPVTMEAGVWIGVFATDVEEQVVALNALVEKPNESGVYPLTAEQYDAKVKKKAQTLLDYKVLKNVSTASRVVPSANPAEDAAPDAEVRESKEVSREEVDSLFAPTQVKEPESPPTPPKQRRRRKSLQPESTEA